MSTEAEKLALDLLTGRVKDMTYLTPPAELDDSIMFEDDPYAEWGPNAGGIEPTIPLLADFTPIGDADAMIEGAANRDPLATALAALSFAVPGTIRPVREGLDMSHAARMQRAAEMGYNLPNPTATRMLESYPYPDVIEEYGGKENLWFHGTKALEFEGFETKGIKRQTSDPNTLLGTHFAASPVTAAEFTGDRYSKMVGNPRIIPARLKVENPKIYDMEGDLTDDALRWGFASGKIKPSDMRRAGNSELATSADNLGAEALNFPNMYHEGGRIIKSLPKKRQRAVMEGFKESLKVQGHDGIIYGNAVEGTYGNPAAIIFEGNQARVPWAAFDPTRQASPDLLASYAAPVLLSTALASLGNDSD